MILLLAALVGAAWADPAAFEVDGAPADGSGQPGVGRIPDDLLALAGSVANRPLPERMGVISKALLGRPYVNDPMGEGRLPDADPFARYDAFDCLTFAEEVLALSMAGDPAHAASVRSSLRYGEGTPRDYAHRRHFMELQWIPGVIADGWLRDATADYGPVTVLDKQVTPQTWAGWAPRKKFALTDAELPMGRMHLEVLTLDQAAKVATKIRPGSLILTVRIDRAGVPLWVTHVSLLVPADNGGTVMRHATKIGQGGTRDHALPWYLDHLRTYKNWTVLGIAVLEPIEQQPRRIAEGS